MAALERPGARPHDAGLREEVRQLVVARNERRMRQGEEPLDVESRGGAPAARVSAPLIGPAIGYR